MHARLLLLLPLACACVEEDPGFAFRDAGQPAISAEPFDFGAVGTTCSVRGEIEVVNEGARDLEITDVALAGGGDYVYNETFNCVQVLDESLDLDGATLSVGYDYYECP